MVAELDAPETTEGRTELIQKRKFLRKLYSKWYDFLLGRLDALPDGPVLEIGSGGGFLREVCDRVITSEVMVVKQCDLALSAHELPFADSSLSAIFLLDVLHHVPDCEKFFAETVRVLKPGGEVIMSEPANTPFSRFFYQRFHHEPFDPSSDWKIEDVGGPLTSANGAIPWIVFTRDKARFERQFPELKIVKKQLHTPFLYFLSGGLSKPALVPGWAFSIFDKIERLARPTFPAVAMFELIVLKKDLF